MATEIERKFVVENHPDAEPQSEHRIRQAYLLSPSGLDQEPAELRVRQEAGVCTATIKIGMPPARTEIEHEITRPEFEEVWNASGRRLSKTRTTYNFNGYEAEVDEFPNGLLLMEVEFGSMAEAENFSPPPEAEDVTGDISYTNAAISRRPYAKKMGRP